MKLELKHLAPYLPYGLKIKTTHGWDSMLTLNDWSVNGDCEQSYCYETEDTTDIKPILRPLSYLAKEIEVNGEKFVPRDTDLLGKYEISVIPVFDFFDGTGSNQNIDDLPYCVIQKLHEWHFDIYGLIENGLAVDINTL